MFTAGFRSPNTKLFLALPHESSNYPEPVQRWTTHLECCRVGDGAAEGVREIGKLYIYQVSCDLSPLQYLEYLPLYYVVRLVYHRFRQIIHKYYGIH